MNTKELTHHSLQGIEKSGNKKAQNKIPNAWQITAVCVLCEFN